MPEFIELQVNGKSFRIAATPDRSLLRVLREELDLTGAKYGCGEAQCGACTVLLDGRAVRSCVVRIGSLQRHHVTTIEGLEKDGELHPIQEAFLEEEALQCGYCTPGMILSGAALLERSPRPSREEIVRAMEGNICRCGVYSQIVAALLRAAEKSGKERP